MNTNLFSQNTDPTFTSTAVTTVDENVTYSYTISTTDTDGDVVAVTGTTLPSWLTVTTTTEVSTLAGSSTSGSADGTGTAAQFSTRTRIALDASGTLYVSDQFNNTIRKVSALGVVTTFAGGTKGFADGTGTDAQFSGPAGIALDASGNIYVADQGNSRIRKISPTGVVTTLAGNGSFSFAEGTGTEARFHNPIGVAVDASGNVYVSDLLNNRIRKITPIGVVTTLAGGTFGFADGTGTEAKFTQLEGLAIDASGTLYVADQHANRIRKITTPAGVVTTLAGDGTRAFADGTGIGAQFSLPAGVNVDASGNIYVADLFNHRIRKISPIGVVTTVAGDGTRGFVDGTATAAQFFNPQSVAINASGTVYVADTGNKRIRQISVVTKLTGTPTSAEIGDHNVVLQASDGNGGTVSQAFTITVADATPPIIVSTSPSDDVTGVTVDSNIVLTFDENIFADTGAITIYDASDDSAVETIAAGSANVSITGKVATINPTSDLAYNDSYYVQIGATALKDAADNHFIGILDKTTLSFTAESNADPTFTSTAVTAVDENVAYSYTISTADTDGDAVTVSGTTLPNWLAVTTTLGVSTLAGTPTSAEVGDHDVVLQVSDGKGGTASQAFTVTVADTTPSIIVSTSPVDDATGVTVDSNIVLTFDENIFAGTGNVTIHDASDDSAVETIAVGSANVTITGQVATINPTSNLTYNKSYYVQIAATALKDAANNNFAGISDKTTLNFTINAVTIAATVFLEGAYNGTNLDTSLNSNLSTNQPYTINGHGGAETAGSIPANTVDWVLVELREAASAATALNGTKVGSAAGFLMNDGTIKATNGTSNLTVSLTGSTGANFFVVIYHRNHLPIMSSSAITGSSGTLTIDFTNNSANTYQTTTALSALGGGKFGMIAGDADGDGDVDATDLTTWRGQNGGVFSYNTTSGDFNLDGVINAVDRNAFQRKNASKTSQVPGT